MVNSAAEFAASSNHAHAVFLASIPALDVAVDAETLVWKPILDWIFAHPKHPRIFIRAHRKILLVGGNL